MGIGEKNTTFRKSIEVRGQGLGVPTHDTNPVIQIVHRDKKNIGSNRLVCPTVFRMPYGDAPDHQDAREHHGPPNSPIFSYRFSFTTLHENALKSKIGMGRGNLNRISAYTTTQIGTDR